MKWLVNLIHGLPRFDFGLHPVEATFRPRVPKYWESLGWWSAACGAACCLLLVIIAIVWIVRCCLNGRQPAKRVAHVKKLSFTLFFLSVVSFIWLGVCFFGNERVNRGIGDATAALQHISGDVSRAQTQLDAVRTWGAAGVNKAVGKLRRLVRDADREQPANESLVSEMYGYLDNMTKSATNLNDALDKTNVTIGELHELDRVQKIVKRIEFERWVSFCVLFAIMVAVLFGSVVGFCRYSKKAAVVFSGIGLVIYLVGCLLLCATVAITIAVADACHDANPFLWGVLRRNDTCAALRYYQTCAPAGGGSSAGSLPPSVSNWLLAADRTLGGMHAALGDLRGDAKLAWPERIELADTMANESKVISSATKALGAVENTLACGPIHAAWRNTELAVCQHTILGATITLLGLALFLLTIHMLLLLVAKAWFLYSRQPLDYVEVDDDDPFVPRGMAAGGSANGGGASQPIAVDVYGTYNYNPRGRYASNGGDSDGNDTMGTTPLWSRGAPPPAMRQDVYEVYS